MLHTMNSFVQQVLDSGWENTSAISLSDGQILELNEMDSKHGILCLLKMWFTYTHEFEEGKYCNATWDYEYCWPPTQAGTVIRLPCSETFNGTRSYAKHLRGNAERVCLENGTWQMGIHSNYDECANSFEMYKKKVTEDMQLVFFVQHMLFYGSILSLLSLFIALMIFYKFRCLWCDRVIIHTHLMVALVLRFIILIVITEPFVLKRDSTYRDMDAICKAVLILHLFATVCTVSWMFIQGLYLNSNLTSNLLSANTREHFAVYYFIGWGIPLILMFAYFVAMMFHEDTKGCWKGYADMTEMWILFGPILAALLLNALFLTNILRTLIRKIRRSSSQTELPIVAAAKATLVLFPVLGVNNLLLLYNPGGDYEKYYVTLNSFFGSTQGFFVSIVYCFNNREVKSAIDRSINRMKARRPEGYNRHALRSTIAVGESLGQPFVSLQATMDTAV